MWLSAPKQSFSQSVFWLCTSSVAVCLKRVRTACPRCPGLKNRVTPMRPTMSERNVVNGRQLFLVAVELPFYSTTRPAPPKRALRHWQRERTTRLRPFAMSWFRQVATDQQPRVARCTACSKYEFTDRSVIRVDATLAAQLLPFFSWFRLSTTMNTISAVIPLMRCGFAVQNQDECVRIHAQSPAEPSSSVRRW